MYIKVCESDEEIIQLARVAKDIWYECYTELIPQEQIEYMLDRFQSEDALRDAIFKCNYTYFLLYDEEIIAYCGVQPQMDRLFLSKLYVRKDKRGLGYASKLLDTAIEFGLTLKKRALYLTCNKENNESLEMYKAKGFQNIASQENDIGGGFVMDDFVLEFELNNKV